MSESTTRDELLALRDKVRTRAVHIAHWKRDLVVCEMRGDEAERYFGRIRPILARDEIPEHLRAELVCKTLVDPVSGARLFEDGEVDEVARFPTGVLQQLYQAASALNMPVSQEAIEETAGNS